MTDLTPERVLAYLNDNPDATTKQEIARGLGVKGKGRSELREIIKELEADGHLTRTGKRAWAHAGKPPATGVVVFERLDEYGDLIGRSVGRDGPFGPEIVFAGVASKSRETPPGVGDKALCRIEKHEDSWRAKLIKALGRGETATITGLFATMRHGGGRITPANKKDRREVLVEANDRNGAEDGDLVTARLKPSRRRHTHGPKQATIVEIIGKASDPKSASLLAIHAHGIPTDFPDEVVKEAVSARPAPCEREDLTRIPLITIDPEDARDHDDAVFAEALEDGWRVIVAIADVAAFVTEGSALDREAVKRGNSTYFPDRVVPMLPEELSADACSLREHETRACLAVEIEFDTSGTKRRHRFIRGTMRSAAKLSYTDAQRAIDGDIGGPGDAFLDNILRPLWGAYAAVAKARDKRGPLDLDLPEKRVQLSDEGHVESITTRARFDAHRLIEEFMIQANVCAAESLEKARQPLIYRVHD
ncbi:MAG: RNB domain-containing ribonuclease, partial [Pseudomonadota bacterium]